MSFEGMLGAIMNRMSGGANGVTSTISVKGSRMARMNESNGQIVDLAEEKIYSVDVRRKEYTVMTFAEMREQLEKLKADMAKQSEKMDPEAKAALQEAGRQLEFDVDVKETGQQKAIAGHNAREFVVAITMREQGRKLEESGGLVMTSNVWMAPRIEALDEMHAFNLKFVKAVYGDALGSLNPQQMGALSAMLPGVASLMQQMQNELKKLQGTAVSSVTVVESVKSAEQMKAAAAQSGGGGIGGMIARRMARGQSQQRSKLMTTTNDILSVGATVAAEDVAIPATFKLKS
jgi:mevalonate kinase